MQNDFVLCDKYSKIFQTDIENTLERGYNDINNEVVNSFDITKCDRRIYYKLIDGTSDNMCIEVHQSYLIKKWLNILSKVESFSALEDNLIVADHNYNITSKVDIIGSLFDSPVVIRIKEIDEDTFQNKTAKRLHVIEVMIQMWLSEVNDGFLVYENITTKQSSVFHILPNVSVLNAVKQKLKALRDYKIRGIVPEQKYETPNSKECKECSFIDKCWR